MNAGESRARFAGPYARRPFAAVLSAALVLLGSGCSHSTATDHGRVEGSAARAARAAVPLPERTPFDRDQRLRAIYLMAYARGYELTISELAYESPGCLCEADGDPDRYVAEVEGFFAGKRAAEATLRARGALGDGGIRSNRAGI